MDILYSEVTLKGKQMLHFCQLSERPREKTPCTIISHVYLWPGKEREGSGKRNEKEEVKEEDHDNEEEK